MTLAATKLAPPALPARHVVRAELIRIVTDPLPQVILVSAPAGSGKTTLLASLDVEKAWLQLEPADRDPTRFWVAVGHAVDRVRPGVAAPVEAVARATRGSADAVVPVLVNLLVTGPRLVVVLDDLHVVTDDVGIDLLVDLLPPMVTLAIGTRVDPPLRLGGCACRAAWPRSAAPTCASNVTSSRTLQDSCYSTSPTQSGGNRLQVYLMAATNTIAALIRSHRRSPDRCSSVEEEGDGDG